jgi:hypothetical protein
MKYKCTAVVSTDRFIILSEMKIFPKELTTVAKS